MTDYKSDQATIQRFEFRSGESENGAGCCSECLIQRRVVLPTEVIGGAISPVGQAIAAGIIHTQGGVGSESNEGSTLTWVDLLYKIKEGAETKIELFRLFLLLMTRIIIVSLLAEHLTEFD